MIRAANDHIVLVAVSAELARVMLEENGFHVLRDTRVHLEPADDYERATTGATYRMTFREVSR